MILSNNIPTGRKIIPYPPSYQVKSIDYSGFGYPLPSLITTSPLPPSLSSLALSLLGRLLHPLLRQSPPLPLGYIGREWIGEGAPGEFEPIKNLIPLISPTRFPPTPTSPYRIKCGEICARDTVGRRSLLPPSFGTGSAWFKISLVVKVSSCLWTGARGSGFRAWLGLCFSFEFFLLLDQLE